MKQFAMIVHTIEEGDAGSLSGSFNAIDFANGETFEKAVANLEETYSNLGYKLLSAAMLEELPVGYINDKTYARLFALAEQKIQNQT